MIDVLATSTVVAFALALLGRRAWRTLAPRGGGACGCASASRCPAARGRALNRG